LSQERNWVVDPRIDIRCAGDYVGRLFSQEQSGPSNTVDG
jgi:hypothetical protein